MQTLPEDAFFIDRDADEGLQMQLRQSIAAAILEGRLQVGVRMPSSRRLAAHLGISRITVTLAYQELMADGYLTSRDRSGYYVPDSAPVAQNPVQVGEAGETLDWSARLTRAADGAAQNPRVRDWRSYRYPFVYGQADADLFSHSAWRACAHRALGRRDFDAMVSDTAEQDDPELIQFICSQTLPRRGIAARPEQVLITMGAQNALSLVTQLLLTPERKAVVENPGYPGLRDILKRSGAQIAPVGVDADGMPPGAIPAAADLVFVAPSHQAPTNATMPMARRRALLDRAQADDFLVVEDDYEFELSFARAPLPALRAMEGGSGRVIYVGSFSKSIFPGLRLGYLVAPEPFITAARALRTAMLRHPPGHIQRTTAYFLRLGHYDALIRRLREALRERRQAMEQAIAAEGLEPISGSSFGGSSFWMRAPNGVNTTDLAARLRPLGVLIEPGAPFWHEGHMDTYRLGYSSIPTERIAPGLQILASNLAREAL